MGSLGLRGEPLAPGRFRNGVACAAAVGLAIRVVNALSLPKPAVVSDAQFYHIQANLLADHYGFVDPYLAMVKGRFAATAVHPPLFPLLLSVSSWFGGDTVTAHRVVASLLGVATILIVAMLARELAGERAGLVAAVIAAAYPNLWAVDGSLLAEGLGATLVALALWFTFCMLRRTTILGTAALGATLALAALTRPETILLVPLLALPVIFTRRELELRRRALLATTLIAVTGAVLAPWLVRNLTGFSRPVLFSTNGDQVLAVANCTATYYNAPTLGYWWFPCNGHTSIADDAERSSKERDAGLKYIRNHLARFAGTVVPARLGRIWDVYRPFENARYSASEGRHVGVAYAGIWGYWACMLLAAVGCRRLWKTQRDRCLVLLSTAAVVTITAIYAYGAVRFRAIAEPAVVVFAAVGVVQLCQRGAVAERPGEAA